MTDMTLDKEGSQEPAIDIPGIDIKTVKARYGGDFNIYLHILRTYASSTPKLIDKLRDVAEDTLRDCTINAHSLKGSSANIGAEQIRAAASELETAARGGDLKTASRLAGPLVASAETLVADIAAWLADYDSKNRKQRMSSPDPEILLKLRQGCETYDISSIDSAMDELESIEYEDGGDLVAWLREKVDVMEMEEVVERLTNLL